MSALRYHVCYAADENFAAIAAASIVSLLENNSLICPELSIWILDNGLSEENRAKLTELCDRYSVSLRFIDAGDMTDRIKSLQVSPGNYGSFATYTRLFMPELLPEEVGRILYLDCDTLVLSDIRPLFELPMEDDQCILGIRDLVSSCDVHLFRRIGYTGNTYINAGVLLIDPVRWRQWHLTDAIFEHIRNLRSEVPFLDQDLINIVCQRHIGILSPKYDHFTCCGAFTVRQLYVMYFPRKYASYYYPPEVFEAETKDPVILHFAGAMFYRPWVEGADGPYVSLWREYAGMTGFEVALKDRAGEPVRFKRAAVALKLPKGLYSVLFRVRREIVDRWRHRGPGA